MPDYPPQLGGEGRGLAFTDKPMTVPDVPDVSGVSRVLLEETAAKALSESWGMGWAAQAHVVVGALIPLAEQANAELRRRHGQEIGLLADECNDTIRELRARAERAESQLAAIRDFDNKMLANAPLFGDAATYSYEIRRVLAGDSNE